MPVTARKTSFDISIPNAVTPEFLDAWDLFWIGWSSNVCKSILRKLSCLSVFKAVLIPKSCTKYFVSIKKRPYPNVKAIITSWFFYE